MLSASGPGLMMGGATGGGGAAGLPGLMMQSEDAYAQAAGAAAVYRAICANEGGREMEEWEKDLCQAHPLLKDLDANSLRSVSQGALRGIRECKSQFASERWNCPTYPNTTSVFGVHTMKRGQLQLWLLVRTAIDLLTSKCSESKLSIIYGRPE
jgi:hypothetical protein